MPRPIDADALIKEIDKLSANTVGTVIAKQAIRRMVEIAPTVPTFGTWVSINDRMPENGQIVLVRQVFSRVRNEEGAEITIGAYNARPEEQTHPYWEFQHYRNDMRDRTIMDNSIICPGNEYVTHWMPLPCSPKEAENDA